VEWDIITGITAFWRLLISVPSFRREIGLI